MRKSSLLRTIGLTASLLLASVSTAHAQKTLKAVMDAELQVLDPIATTSYVTRTFAYLVYDTLIAMDSKGDYKPQMLESFSASADRMTYTFKLRDGLEWSDGAPVTAEDCVASIKRWAARDGLGKMMMAATASISVVDSKTFTLKLAKPFGFVIEALGKPSSNVPVMMPARIAANADPAKPVAEVIGSGPFVFKKEQWVPGSRAVFEKNPRYKPRSEPADGLAGGKNVYIDRLEMVSLPDSASKIAALQAGEIHYLQYTPFDFINVLKRNSNIVLDGGTGLANFMGAMRPNHLQPPFNNVKVRQALQALMVQKDFQSAIGLPADMLLPECLSVFMCNSTYSSTAGTENLKNPGVEKAKRLLKEAGYKGEKVVVLHSTDVPTIHLSATVIEELMKQAGFNVEVAASDWSTVAQRRWSKEPTDKGGWSLLPLIWAGHDLGSPLTHYGVAYNCTDGYAGWSCDEETKKLLEQFTVETDLAKRKALADGLQKRVHEDVSVVLWGQYVSPSAYSKSLSGLLSTGIPLFWNVKMQ